MKNIYKKAWFFKLRLYGNISYETLKTFAEKIGFRIVLANNKVGQEVLSKYGIVCDKKAFTYVSGQIKLIVLNSEIADEMKLLLLHEIAHILLGHTENKPLNPVRAEMEADAFAYYVIRISPLRAFCSLLAVCIVMGLCISFAFSTNTQSTTTASTHRAQDTSPSGVQARGAQDPQKEYDAQLEQDVYITPSGKKYHTFDCRYIHESTAVKLPILEAEKQYEPCKVCNP